MKAKHPFMALALAAVLAAGAAMPAQAQRIAQAHYKKALVVGAHPDDPETIAGGTMLVLKGQGCEVVSVYLTGGEAGIAGKSHDEAAAIRHKESEDACRVIEREKPDVVFTHWPIDAHRDHRATSLLMYDAWRQLDHSFDLYYAEAMSGLQSQNFIPTDYVNIDSVVAKKHEACMCHVSQGMPDIINGWHGVMERFRGIEFHCKAAEAFSKQLWPENGMSDR